MNLIDVLANPEMDLYFDSLPQDIQRQLLASEDGIHSSNDLYVQAEKLLHSQGQ